jgi:hypothetical protein
MTAARTSAQNAAMEALLEAHATELKLPTVKARFRAMATEATREQQTLRPRPTASDSATAARAQLRSTIASASLTRCPDARLGSSWRALETRRSALFNRAMRPTAHGEAAGSNPTWIVPHR